MTSIPTIAAAVLVAFFAVVGIFTFTFRIALALKRWAESRGKLILPKRLYRKSSGDDKPSV